MSQIGIWLWDYTLNKWVKYPASSTAVRLLGTGQVIAGQHYLCWMTCNPAAGNSLWEVTDAIAAGGAVVIDCFSTSRESKMGSFRPPIYFATGIYLETFTNMTSITFGYV